MRSRSIQIQHVSKSFGTVQALNDINLQIEEGQLFGLIGPDGAGKSTLFRILTSLLIPDAGEAIVAGYHTVRDYRKLRKIVGYMPGRFSLYQDLSVEENLTFFATIFGTTIQANYHLVGDIYRQLEPFKKRKAGQLSGGMKQKLALCCALIHEPEVLFLDEPTTGVDAVSRAEFWDMLKSIKSTGITIVVSTPYMDEAARCESIALIDDGQILKIDRPVDIVSDYPYPLFAVKGEPFYQLLQGLRTQAFTARVEPFGEYLHLSLHLEYEVIDIWNYLTNSEFQAVEVQKIGANIEDVFLELMTPE
ncbi:MAG: ABC transporter ATP-binding protein [Bacteroidota bacterium]